LQEVDKLAKVSEYRDKLRTHQDTARKIVLDEIEDEVKRLRDYADGIDLDSTDGVIEGLQTIKLGLKELAEKLY
jgi:hypothetical protein